MTQPVNQPTAVVMTLRDGTEREAVFASRFLAELFLSYLPIMAGVAAEFAEVQSAILSPLERRTVAATPVDN